MVSIETFENLEEQFGLDLILEQNDIERWEVIRLLYFNGLIDLEDYFYTDIDEEDIEHDD